MPERRVPTGVSGGTARPWRRVATAGPALAILLLLFSRTELRPRLRPVLGRRVFLRVGEQGRERPGTPADPVPG
jgi:hypothetical protein